MINDYRTYLNGHSALALLGLCADIGDLRMHDLLSAHRTLEAAPMPTKTVPLHQNLHTGQTVAVAAQQHTPLAAQLLLADRTRLRVRTTRQTILSLGKIGNKIK